ncbi:conjugal transfer protein TraI [Sphingopyxis indica]|uniref:TrbI/VirB10 family protein n=1 Tax=Sphingomonadales TaxID=204457 RepID=UPI0029391FF1|nr:MULTISPECIES: TrbI/VirB10 family protein [Sphingomonadales]MEA3390388.1 TrbI/VirB10 family protein [Pseudomonadota bacterium]WOF43319.1 conjugal transfer protein TraI [Sphingopyxis indica]WRO66099.1 TrbI/VirB10 family protein [Tsuneonella sp. CC-YZS046]
MTGEHDPRAKGEGPESEDEAGVAAPVDGASDDAPQQATEEDRPLQGPPLADPAGFRLRGEPPRVMRLSRKAMAILGGAGALAVGGALTFALQSRDRSGPEELYNTDSRAVTEQVATGPRDYSQLPPGVPQLGDPLPGDLGGPILAAQQGDPTGIPGDPSAAGPQGLTPEELAAQRAAQEQEAAIASRLFLGGQAGASAQAAGAPASMPGLDLADLGAATPTVPEPADGPNMQRAKRDFVERGPEGRTLNSGRLVDPVSPHIVQAGSVIAAALITGIRSDLPGQVTAQVTQSVYDSPTGRTLLIPQGSRLIGDYDAEVAFGQRRVLLVWNRLILPDGRSIILDRQPTGDPSGYAGLEDKVNEHWGGILRAAGLSTLLSIGAELGTDSDDDIARAIRDGGQNTINQAGQDIVRRQLNIQPTLTVRPGYPVRVLVSRDLVLAPWRQTR